MKLLRREAGASGAKGIFVLEGKVISPVLKSLQIYKQFKIIIYYLCIYIDRWILFIEHSFRPLQSLNIINVIIKITIKVHELQIRANS